MGIGAHPAFLFATNKVDVNGMVREVTTTPRYAAWELVPTFNFNRHVGVGVYYPGGHGLTPELIQLTSFIAVRAVITRVPIGKKFDFSLVPPLYYLRQDSQSGYYTNASITGNDPFSTIRECQSESKDRV